MIDLFDEKQVRKLIWRRKVDFELNEEPFWILTSLNHLFFIDQWMDLSLRDLSTFELIYSPEILKLYDLTHTHENFYISFTQKPLMIQAFYDKCIADLSCMFFSYTRGERKNIIRELQHRGLR